MSSASKIEWTQATWNPIVGCSIVSPGCTNCYAMRMAARIERMSPALDHYRGLTRKVNGNPVWTGKLALAPERVLTEPLRRRKPTVYFVNSMGDLFHEDVPDAWIDRVFAVMALTPEHTYQVLTKRSARMRAYIDRIADALPETRESLEQAAVDLSGSPCGAHAIDDMEFPLPNVWLGVSAERQQEAAARIPDLLATPAAVRFVSYEPALGSIDLTRWLPAKITGGPGEQTLYGIDWVICGGESGPGARPMHPDWARSIRDQCQAAGVAFFFKQWGAWVPVDRHPVSAPAGELRSMTTVSSTDRREIGCQSFHAGRGDGVDSEILRNVGKARAGRLLDGREWNEMPATIQNAPPQLAEAEG